MASVDDLLGRMHRQAASLKPKGQPDRQLQEHLVGWIPLAAKSRRVLESLDPRPGEHPDFYGLLESLTRRRRITAGKADSDLEALALTVGALGSLLLGGVRASELAAAGLVRGEAGAIAAIDAAFAPAMTPLLDIWY